MSQRKEIRYGGKNVGTVQISREGLYYRFECRCKFQEEGIYRLYALSAEKKAYLGVCVPIGDVFGITTRIPVNKLGTGNVCVAVETKPNEKVFPVDQEKPFPGIEELDRAVLCPDGIRFKAKSPDRQDNDQSREHQHK